LLLASIPVTLIDLLTHASINPDPPFLCSGAASPYQWSSMVWVVDNAGFAALQFLPPPPLLDSKFTLGDPGWPPRAFGVL